MPKQTVAVLFGGQSTEHEISCISAVTIAHNIDPEKYETLLVGITKEGNWLLAGSTDEIQAGTWRESKKHAILSPDAEDHGLFIYHEGSDSFQKIPVDVVFPALHGARGEDGTVQGLLELAKIPYVGCGVLSSAISMDKLYTKWIVSTLGIRQAAYETVYRRELKTEEGIQAAIRRVEGRFPYPVFVKPCCSGSSRGVTKADGRDALRRGLLLAAEHDRKMLVEETIVGREIECAVLGGDEAKASGVGEILAGAAFYDYEAKYASPDSKTIIDPSLPGGATEAVREAAVRIFQALECFGLARVDFFVTGEGTVIFNEINTLPGFTSISMYPMLWENRGLSKFQLINRLISLAEKRP